MAFYTSPAHCCLSESRERKHNRDHVENRNLISDAFLGRCCRYNSCLDFHEKNVFLTKRQEKSKDLNVTKI